MDLLATKMVVLALLAVIRLACGLLPFRITKCLQLWGEQPASSHLLVQRRRVQIDRGLSLCLCFGGGVLLATCFLHMLPEAREALEAARRAPSSTLSPDSQFPFAELFVCVGFFLVYVIEEVAQRVFGHSPAAAGDGDGDGDGDSDAPPLALTDAHAGDLKMAVPLSAPAIPEKLPPTPPPALTAVAAAPPLRCATVEAEFHKVEVGTDLPAPAVTNGDAEKSPPWTRPLSSSKIAPATSQVHLLSSTLSLEQKDPKGLPLSAIHHHHHHHHHDHPLHVGHHHHHHHHHHHDLPVPVEQGVMGHLRSLMVVMALSFHSVFEGLAIGLQPTQRDVWYLFAAVSVHASAILFCVGLELVMSGMRLLSMLAYLCVLALVSPLGVAMGVLVTCVGGADVTSPEQTLAVGALQGVAGGTLLYVTFFEVLDREKRRGDSAGPLRLAFVLAGFVVMVLLQVIGGHEHSGEEQHGLHEANGTHQGALPGHGHHHGHSHTAGF